MTAAIAQATAVINRAANSDLGDPRMWGEDRIRSWLDKLVSIVERVTKEFSASGFEITVAFRRASARR